MGARGDRRGDARGRSRRDRRRGRPVATRDADTSEDEWTEEDGDVSRDVEAGGALARDGSRDASSSAAPSRDARHERASRHASWSVPIRTASERLRGELEPILKKTSSRFEKRPRSSRSFAEADDERDEYDLDALDASSSFGRRHKTRARVVLGATLVLGLACATGVTVVSAAAHRERIAERVATFPARFSSERAGGPALRGIEREKSFAHDASAVPRLSGSTRVRSSDARKAVPQTETRTTSFGSEAFYSVSDFGGAASPPTAARAGLFLPARPSSALGRDEPHFHRDEHEPHFHRETEKRTNKKSERERRAFALSRLRDAPLLGRFLGIFDEKEEKDLFARDEVDDDVFSLSPQRDETRFTSTRLSNAAISYARDGLEDLFFPALGDFAETSPAKTKPDDVSGAALGDSVPKTEEKKYLIGLTTSAGFGDQFKRMSTYAAMARELNRTLVVWPVFTSPHYDLDGKGPRKEGARPLFFDEYVRIGGDGVTDDADRLVSYRDPSLPARVRAFPTTHPEACLTSNGEKVDVQFLTSADLSKAVVAKADTATSYEEQVSALRRAEKSSTSSPETLCVASTFGDADYNKARHGETALAWKSLDFKPVGRFHHWWANAVDNMVLSYRTGDDKNDDEGSVADENEDANGKNKSRATALRAFDARLDGRDAGAGAVENRAAAMELVDVHSEPNPGRKESFQRTDPSFRVTSQYTALHWRRGDKCGRASKRQASRRVGPNGHAFDAKKTGASNALLCDEASYVNAPVLDLCEPLAPMYVATDDQDETFLRHVKSKGCLLRDDVVVSPPSSDLEKKTIAALEDVDALVLDVMLVAGAEVSFTYGHTALARLYDRMRMSRGAPRSINVAADAEAFRRAYAAAKAGSGAAAAAAAALGEREGELVANNR